MKVKKMNSKHPFMQNFQVMLALCICMAILVGCAAPGATSIDNLIITRDPLKLAPMPEQEVVDFFESHQSMIESLSTYMLANERLFGTRPISIGRGHPEQVKKLKNADMESMAAKLLEQGIFASVWSLNDDPSKSVHFIVDTKLGNFEQGIRFVSDPETLDWDREYAPYNQVLNDRDLGSGWYYYLNYYNDIKKAEDYQRAAWEDMPEQAQLGILHDWSEAQLEIWSRDNVSSRLSGQPCDYVVAVIFRTDQDGLLGPLTIYINPYTKEVIGRRGRE